MNPDELQENSDVDVQEQDEVADQPAEKAEAAAPSEAETRARRMGWHPKDEYEASGRDPSKWVDAETFMRRGEEELPVLRDRFRKLERITDKQAKEIAEGTKLLRDLVASQKADREKAVKKALEDLNKQRREAVSNGDEAAVERISDEISEQKASLKEPVQAEKDAKQDKSEYDEMPQEIVAWTEANPWFNSDSKMRAVAIAEYGEVQNDKSLTETQKLAKAKAEVMKRFPEKFPANRRNQPPSVEAGGSGTSRRSNAKSWNDIPAEDRAIAERLVAAKVLTRDQYVKDYFG